ncbi:MAG: DUF2156 domain-containing protein [Promethearchaeota archaeon]|jgi:hypothetical protein
MDLGIGKVIEISDKPLFDKYFKNYPPNISEFTFTNLFMWRMSYNFSFVEWDNHLILFSRGYFGKHNQSLSGAKEALFFLPPIGPDSLNSMVQIFETFEEAEFHRAPQNTTERIQKDEEFASLNLEIIEDRNNWDYIYEVENLKNLPGNRYRQNRRWLNKFLESYKYEFQVLSEDMIKKCKELQLEWCIMKGCEEDEGLGEEQKAIGEALDNYSSLKFKGAMLCVNDKCVAYTLGEMLNSNTLVIHIEKAHMKYEGAYQAINNLFLKNCCENAIWVNREQDLGIPGLKRAKESYKPSSMVKKSVIFRKN